MDSPAPSSAVRRALARASAGKALDVDEATVLLGVTGADLDALMTVAGRVRDAGLVDVETKTITVLRTFDDFESLWRIALTGPRLAPLLSEMPEGDRELLRSRLRDRLPAGADGRITCSAWANAIKGRVG